MKYSEGDKVSKEKIEDTDGLFLEPWIGSEINTEGKDSIEINHQKLTLEPGGEDRYHSHEITYDLFTVYRGKAAILINGEEKELEAGDSILVEPGDKHKLFNPGEEKAEVIETRLNVVKGDKKFL